MDVQVEKTGPYNCKLSVTVPASDVDQVFERVYRRIAKSAKIPGFRPGKAPRSVLDMHFGQQVRDEVENQLVVDTLSQAIEERHVDAVSRPRVETGDLKKGTTFSYTAEVEVRPEIELATYKGLAAPEVSVEVNDAEVDAELETLRQQSAQLVPVLIRDTVEQGDLVLVDYEGFIGGLPIEGGKADSAIVEIGAEGYLPGFSEALEGAKVPSEREIPVDFPEDYSVEQLRGKSATFRVTIKELKTRELPALDDEFAGDLGEESLEALRKKIRDGIDHRRRQEAESQRREGILKALVAANPFDVPPAMVAEQTDRMIADAASRVQQMMGGRFDVRDLDIESLRRDNRERAEFQVRSGLLMLEVAKTEGLEVAESDIEAEIGKIAGEAGEQAQRVIAHYHSPEQRERLSYRLLEDKTISFLLDHARGAQGEPKKTRAASAESEPAEDAPKKKSSTTKKSGTARKTGATRKTGSTRKASSKKT